MTHRDFDAARAEAVSEPLTFTLGGETFNVPRPIPALPMLDLAAASDEDGDEVKSITAFRDFLLSVLLAEDAKRFRAACQKARADSDTLGELAQWLVEEASGRPLEQPSGSATSPLTNGATSNLVSVPRTEAL